jgi:hypothetical protein
MNSPATLQPIVSRIAYDSGYYLTYGVVFPTVFLVHLIPGVRGLTSGFVDGAAAARKYVDGLAHQNATSLESTPKVRRTPAVIAVTS